MPLVGALMAAESELRSVALFSELSDEQLSQIAVQCRAKTLKKGDILFREGEEGNFMAIILSGALSLTQTTPDGKKIAGRRREGEVLGESSLLSPRRRASTSAAETDVELLLLDRIGLEEALLNSPQAALEILRALSSRILPNVGDSQTGPLRSRVLAWLRQECGPGCGPAEIKVIKATLAAHLGVRRETLSRCFAKLQRQGILKLTSRSVIIGDRGKLR
jgi:CRP-like cAMP-binding protein